MKYIGFLGPQGTYSHHASNLYSANAIKVPFNTINEVLNSLDTKESQEVVVPLENSINGSIVEVLDFLAGDNKFNIIEELEVNINHSIFTLKTFRHSTIDVIFSHPQALGQCYKYLNEKYQNSELKISNSTADSLNDLLKSGISGAFIGPPWMKDNDAVVEIDKNIQSADNNVTRFVVIGQGIRKKSKQDKTSVVFSFNDDSPGSLHSAIEPLAKKSINMTKIESRPTKDGLGSYYFFVDIEGHVNDQKLAYCLSLMKENVSNLKVLGSYPKFQRDKS
jgi:prephenate dehydratase